jgi:TolA-binding protein
MSRLTRVYPCLMVACLGLFAFGSVAQGAAEQAAAQADLQAYISANGLLNRGHHELAALEYRSFLEAHPDHEKAPVARYGLSVCLLRLGRTEEALEQLEQLSSLKDFAYEPEVWTMLAQCRSASGDHAGAAAACAQMLERHTEHALADDAAALGVEALYRSGKYEDVIAWSENAARLWPKSPLGARFAYFGGLAHIARGEFPEAMKKLEAAVQTEPKGPFADHATLLLADCAHRLNIVDQASRWYRKLLEREGNNFENNGLLGLASLEHQRGDLEAAGQLLDRLLKQSPDASLASSARLERARVWFDEGKYDRALVMLENAPDGELADDYAYWAAKCKLRQGDAAEAQRALRTAIRKYGDSDLLPHMRYDRLVALVRTDNKDDALRELPAFLEAHGDHALAADALHLFSSLLHQAGRYDESLAQCERFLEGHGNHALADDVRLLSAENNYLAGRYEAALQTYQTLRQSASKSASRERLSFRIGMAFYRLARYDEAAQELQSLTAEVLQQPEFLPARLALGEIFFQRGEWKTATQHLQAYVESAAEGVAVDQALLKLGLAWRQTGDLERALSAFDRLLAECPKSEQVAHARFDRGQALLSLERLDEAKDAFETLLRGNPAAQFAVPAQYHLGTIAMRQARYAAAVEHFGTVLRGEEAAELQAEARYQLGQAHLLTEDYAAAQAALSEFLNHHADHAHARRAQAQLALAQARQDHCDDALKTIARLTPQHLAELDGTLHSALRHEQAWCLRELDRPAEAAEVYRGLLKANPNSLDAYAAVELAELEAAAARPKEAAEWLRKLRNQAADKPGIISAELNRRATYRLGLCEFELGNFQEAANLLEAFLTDEPDAALIASASFYGGEANLRLEKPDRAVEHFARVAEKYARDPAHAPSLLRLGECQAELQRWAASEQAFARYLEKYPEQEQWFQARFGVGWACENQQRYDAAIQAYRQVVQKHQGPTAARAQFQIGECLYAQEKHAEAARELLKVDILYAYPEWSAAALFEAGRCFEALQQNRQAREQFEAVVNNHPQTRWADLARERLSALSVASLPGRADGSSDK